MIIDKINQWIADVKPKIILIVSIVILIILIFYPRRYSIEKVKLKQLLDQDIPLSSRLHQTRLHKTEDFCRYVLESILRRPFPSERPDFLKNPYTGRNLECDMINHDLKLAVEYSGAQHYQYNSYFHSSPQKFQQQQERDDIKKILLMRNGYNYIEVPYTITKDQMEGYLTYHLKRLGYL